MADQERLCAGCLLERSVRRGDFVLASGQRSSYYIDCRLTTMTAEGHGAHRTRSGWRRSADAGWRPRAVGGLTMGADPVAYAVAAASCGTRPGDRRLQRAQGSQDARDRAGDRGNFRAGDEVVVVEDVITSGGSAQKAIAAVEGAGGRCSASWRWWTGKRAGERRWSGRGEKSWRWSGQGSWG